MNLNILDISSTCAVLNLDKSNEDTYIHPSNILDIFFALPVLKNVKLISTIWPQSKNIPDISIALSVLNKGNSNTSKDIHSSNICDML